MSSLELPPTAFALAAVWWAIAGLTIGSYLNVVVYRVPRELSTVTPRSRCPRCGALIAWYDNVPLLSWLLLRGRCRRCGNPISFRYPAVEVTCGLLFLACFLHFRVTVDTVAASVFAAMLLALALIDYEFFLLPNRITYPGIVLGLVASPFVDFTNPTASILGAVAGAGVLLLLILVWYLFRGEQGMGYGDVKMLAMLGAMLGLPRMVVALFVAAMSGAAIGLVLLARGEGSRAKLPFGIFLSIGGLVALFFGPWLLHRYLGLL